MFEHICEVDTPKNLVDFHSIYSWYHTIPATRVVCVNGLKIIYFVVYLKLTNVFTIYLLFVLGKLVIRCSEFIRDVSLVRNVGGVCQYLN